MPSFVAALISDDSLLRSARMTRPKTLKKRVEPLRLSDKGRLGLSRVLGMDRHGPELVALAKRIDEALDTYQFMKVHFEDIRERNQLESLRPLGRMLAELLDSYETLPDRDPKTFTAIEVELDRVADREKGGPGDAPARDRKPHTSEAVRGLRRFQLAMKLVEREVKDVINWDDWARGSKKARRVGRPPREARDRFLGALAHIFQQSVGDVGDHLGDLVDFLDVVIEDAGIPAPELERDKLSIIKRERPQLFPECVGPSDVSGVRRVRKTPTSKRRGPLTSGRRRRR